MTRLFVLGFSNTGCNVIVFNGHGPVHPPTLTVRTTGATQSSFTDHEGVMKTNLFVFLHIREQMSISAARSSYSQSAPLIFAT